MPINRALYPLDWHFISHQICVHRAGGQCEYVDHNGRRCEARDWEDHPVTGAVVLLSCAHLDHNPQNNDPSNLMALCQLHHNLIDGPARRQTALRHARQQEQAAGQLELFKLVGERRGRRRGRAMIFKVQHFLEDYFERRGFNDVDQYAVRLAHRYSNLHRSTSDDELLRILHRIRTVFFRNNRSLDREEFERDLVQKLKEKEGQWQEDRGA